MEKDFIDEFIPSKDTKAYLHSIHHEFTDLEKDTIVANHIMISYEEKVKWLNVFMNKISDDALKDRISKALVQIEKYSRKCNTALGALHYNESLSDFVFIPHDFRHGDIVRSLYAGWNKTEFCEKVGIIQAQAFSKARKQPAIQASSSISARILNIQLLSSRRMAM